MSLSGSMREGQAASELTLKEACNGQCCSHAAQLLEARLVPREVSAQCASLSVLALRRHTVHCNNVRITTQIWVKNTTQIWISPFACGALIKMKLLLGGGPDLRITRRGGCFPGNDTGFPGLALDPTRPGPTSTSEPNFHILIPRPTPHRPDHPLESAVAPCWALSYPKSDQP